VDWKEAGGRLKGFGRPDDQEYHHPDRVAFATLCVLLTRWSALEKTGLLDETYHFYDEDLDFCLRLGEAGYGIAYEPSASAVHMVGYSTALRGPSFVYFNMARNRLMTMRKYGTTGRWLRFLPYFSAMMSWKAIRFLFRGETAAARAIVSGIARGVRDRPLPVPTLAPEMEAR
jgi:GT2 family glycosyltransferase